jgi:predicted nucleic acid-binding Zn ribbon protein
MIIEKKKCQSCGKTIHGRADKKFCDDYCRNTFNNLRRSGDDNEIRNVTNKLRINRRILESILVDGVETVRVPKESLYRLGYHFKYHTHTYTNRKGQSYIYCFDYGYLELSEEWILVVRDMGESYLRHLGSE